MNRVTILSMALVSCINLSACQTQNEIESKQSNKSVAIEKSQTFMLHPGEIFVTFITDRKPNTDELFQSYLTTVFPIAFKHGAVPLGNLLYNKVAAGGFNPTDFIGISKWTTQEGTMAFAEEMPHEKLEELRKPIWNDLKAFGVPIKEKISFTLQEGKTYEYKLIYGEVNEIKKSVAEVNEAGGKIVLDFSVSIYEDMKGNAAPKRIVLVEWENIQIAKKYRKKASQSIREESFYTYFSMETPPSPSFKTNYLAQTVNASTDQVWEVLKTGGDVDKWLPFITSCKLEGKGIGAKRICTTADGKTLEESITNIDNENKIITYTIDKHNMEAPIHNIQGIMRVKEKNGKALIDWTVHFELVQEIDDEMLSQMQKGMVESMKTGVNGIEELLQ